MKNRGQAAMEFLMTYGWAILAAIIVIAVLAIYFKPSSLTSNAAVLTAPLYAEAWSITLNKIALVIKNNAGENIVVTFVNATLTSPTGATCTAIETATPVSAGTTTDPQNIACTTLTVGQTVSGTLSVKYTRGAGKLNLTSTGSISGTVA